MLDDVRGFGSDYYYGLIVPRLDGEDIANLGCIDWAFVIDFDQMTDVDGLLSYCREGLEPRRPVHLVKHGDRPTLNIGRGTYWYCAAGLSGHSATIPKSANWIDWNRSYGTDLPRVLNLLSAVSAERPMVLVVLWYGELPIEYLRTAMLGKRRAQQVNLYHAPGSGGTTVLRRVLWDLRSEFPCLLLQRTKPEETTERLAYIASKTGKSILLAIDAGAITDREAHPGSRSRRD